MNRFTRNSLVASWLDAQRRCATYGTIDLTHASAAGMLLEQHRTAHAALAEANERAKHFPWWDDVARKLAVVLGDESEAVAS